MQAIVQVGLPYPEQRISISYSDAERATQLLASNLTTNFGWDEVRKFHYVAIPRGGLIVLGMLSYMLDLDKNKFIPDILDRPIVVVDDCCLSGFRFAGFLESTEYQKVIFAHLYSVPELRWAIVDQEPRVTACIAAADLRDLAHERHPGEKAYQTWKDRWQQGLAGKRYWIGLPEFIVFPWSEPDRPVWVPYTGKIEENWVWTAPDRCLKNWSRLGVPPIRESDPTLRSPDEIIYRLFDGQVLLCNLKTEQVYGLEGAAADMWRSLAAYGDVIGAIDYLMSQYDVDEAGLRNDLITFADDLLAKGLLERVDQPEIMVGSS